MFGLTLACNLPPWVVNSFWNSMHSIQVFEGFMPSPPLPRSNVRSEVEDFVSSMVATRGGNAEAPSETSISFKAIVSMIFHQEIWFCVKSVFTERNLFCESVNLWERCERETVKRRAIHLISRLRNQDGNLFCECGVWCTSWVQKKINLSQFFKLSSPLCLSLFVLSKRDVHSNTYLKFLNCHNPKK